MTTMDTPTRWVLASGLLEGDRPVALKGWALDLVEQRGSTVHVTFWRNGRKASLSMLASQKVLLLVSNPWADVRKRS